jgi:hypothetical protein
MTLEIISVGKQPDHSPKYLAQLTGKAEPLPHIGRQSRIPEAANPQYAHFRQGTAIPKRRWCG